MDSWILELGPRMFWPVLLIIGAISMAIVWAAASAIYQQLSGIAAGAIFMFIGICLLLYCAYNLILADPMGYNVLFWNGLGIMSAIALLGAGAFGIRNAWDF